MNTVAAQAMRGLDRIRRDRRMRLVAAARPARALCAVPLAMRWCMAAVALAPAAAFGQAHATPDGTIDRSSIRVIARQDLPLARALEPVAGGRRVGLSLRVAWIQDTPWTLARLAAAIRQAALIFAQCGIEIDRVSVESVTAPEALRHLDSRGGRVLMQAIGPARPTVVLVHDTRNRPAFEAEAFGRGNTRTRPELTDSVWLTAAVRDAGVALAHELVHVLADSGAHSDLPGNLMQPETEPANTALTEAQCTAVIDTGTERGLLSPRIAPATAN